MEMALIQVQKNCFTHSAAEKYMEEYLQSYHPVGYGTRLKLEFDEESHHWWVIGTRQSSCD
jgi:hypothetical protein